MLATLLILRMVVGLGFAAHGSQKLFGWFGGGGINGTGASFESIGFQPGSRFALAAGLGEFLGVLLLALEFLGPIGPALMVSVMLVAILIVLKGHGFFTENGGAELPILYITGAVTVALVGRASTRETTYLVWRRQSRGSPQGLSWGAWCSEPLAV